MWQAEERTWYGIPVHFLVDRSADRVLLRAPEVGLFAGALPPGSIVVPGQAAGTIETLGRVRALLVPPEVGGRIVSDPPALARSPVGFGDVLYALTAIEAAGSSAGSRSESSPDAPSGRALCLRAPHAGRFYHRPAPGDASFVQPGATVEDGQPVGMIEVMKTFSHVPYLASALLPRRAKVLRLLAADGADVKAGDPLLEVEPA